MKFVFFSHTKKVQVHCTYCWRAHQGHVYDGVLFLWGCGHDARRYFTDHEDYVAYVRAYEEAGGCHGAALMTVGRGEVEGLPLFETQ